MQELLRELAPGCRSRRVGDGLVELEVDLPEQVSHKHFASAVRLAARGFHGRRGRTTQN